MTARTRRRSAVVATLALAVAACLLTSCAADHSPNTTDPSTGRTNMSHSAEGESMTADSANAEQLDLITALEAAVPGAWGEATVNRFRTCVTASGEGGVQITRQVRGGGVSDPGAAAKAFRAALVERGFDAEIRGETEVVGIGDANRYAAFNADQSASIIQAYSACYPFDLENETPTVPPSPSR
jgi:ABC-type phosphate transport system substrate-binding protein